MVVDFGRLNTQHAGEIENERQVANILRMFSTETKSYAMKTVP